MTSPNDGETLGGMDLQARRPRQMVIVAHEFVPGAPQELLEWAKREEIPDIIFVRHPLFPEDGGRSTIVRWIDGKEVSSRRGPIEPRHYVLRYLLHAILTVFWLLATLRPGGWIVAVDPLNCTAAAFARLLHPTARLIFYVIDFVPTGRFGVHILDAIYRSADMFATRASDVVWNLTGRMAEGRTQLGLPDRYRDKQIVVPIGTRANSLLIREPNVRQPVIGFIGHIRPNQGVELLLKAVAQIHAERPQVSALIIGDGPLMDAMRLLADEAGLNGAVEFTGLITERQDWEQRLAGCLLGVAPYEPDPASLTYYADPTKPKDYLGLGLPVLITDVPEIAGRIEDAGAGTIVEYEQESLVRGIERYLDDPALLEESRKSAIELASRFSWDSIFSRAIEESWARAEGADRQSGQAIS